MIQFVFESFLRSVSTTLKLSETAEAASPLPALFDAEAELPVLPVMDPAVSARRKRSAPAPERRTMQSNTHCRCRCR